MTSNSKVKMNRNLKIKKSKLSPLDLNMLMTKKNPLMLMLRKVMVVDPIKLREQAEKGEEGLLRIVCARLFAVL